MAIDLEAIRRKVDQLSGVKKGGNNRNMAKFEPGEYSVRILPVDAGDEDICYVRKFYYNIGNQSILAPVQFGKPDPVQELIKKLHSTKKEEDKEFAKQLYPKTRAFAPVIVRGQEDKGVQIWSFSPNLYTKMLNWILKNGEDFRDPNNGYDLEVTVKKIPGKKFLDTDFDVARKSTPLSKDQSKADQWLKAIPTFDSLYKEQSYDEVKKIMSDWLAGDPQSSSKSEGTEKTSEADDEVEKLAKEVASEKKKPAVKTPAKKLSVVEEEDSSSDEGESHDDLDAALADLVK